jgi:hypothetical protein
MLYFFLLVTIVRLAIEVTEQVVEKDGIWQSEEKRPAWITTVMENQLK